MTAADMTAGMRLYRLLRGHAGEVTMIVGDVVRIAGGLALVAPDPDTVVDLGRERLTVTRLCELSPLTEGAGDWHPTPDAAIAAEWARIDAQASQEKGRAAELLAVAQDRERVTPATTRTAP